MEKITQDQAREKKSDLQASELIQRLGASSIGLGHSQDSGFNIRIGITQQPTAEDRQEIEDVAHPVPVYFEITGTIQAY